MQRMSYLIVFVLILAVQPAALAASIPDTCEATKQKLAGKLAKCLHDAERKRIASGDAVKYADTVAKCTAKFSASWQSAEQKAIDAGGACPTTSDGPSILSSISAGVACVTSELETGPNTCLTCGNGVIDTGEDCDLGTLGGATCDGATGGAIKFGTLGCAADCTFDTSGCASCPPGGQVVGGSCWVLGGAGSACSQACADFGLVYDSATLTYAGSGGTDANCSAVLLALGQPGGAAVGPGTLAPFGCWCAQGGATCYRAATLATTAGSAYPTGQRACACQ